MLSPAEIDAIASAVVRKLRETEGARDDAEFLATRSPAEMKKLAREEMKREDRKEPKPRRAA